MKRDMDLIREIALSVESGSLPGIDSDEIKLPGRTPEEIAYHCRLMVEADILCGIDTRTMDAPFPTWAGLRLTWDGHEFIDNARDDSVWKKVKGQIAEKATSVGFELVKELVIQTVRSLLLGGG